MIMDKVSKIIDRAYAILPMYEEKKRSVVIVDKINYICDDLSGLEYYIKDIDETYTDKIYRCINSLKVLVSFESDDDIYGYPHSYIRKIILDVCGDLKRIKSDLDNLVT